MNNIYNASTSFIVSPDTLKSLKKMTKAFHDTKKSLDEFSFVVSDKLKKQRSGKYILRNGRVVEKSDVKVSYKFYEYGPEDIDFLLMAGLIKEEFVEVSYLIDDSFFKIKSFYNNYLTSNLGVPRVILGSS